MKEYKGSTTDVREAINAADAVASDANVLAKEGWELVSFSVRQHWSGDGSPLRGATVYMVFVRDT